MLELVVRRGDGLEMEKVLLAVVVVEDCVVGGYDLGVLVLGEGCQSPSHPGQAQEEALVIVMAAWLVIRVGKHVE